MGQTLTNHSAEDYVRGYHDANGDTLNYVGALAAKRSGHMVVRVEGLDTEGQHLALCWDVWLEDDGMGGLCLMGEF